MTNIGQHIKKLREQKRIKRRDAARKAGISYDYLCKIENGRRSPNLALLGRISKALGATLEEIITGGRTFLIAEAILSDTAPPSPAHGVPYPLEEWGLERLGHGRPAPRIGWASAGRWDDASDAGFEPGDADEWVYTDHGGERAFALNVEGDSMEPEFSEGEVILVDPDLEARPGDYVVARLDRENEATFKQLKYRRGRHYLHPLNPAYPDIKLDPKAPWRIVGVVIEKKAFFGDADPHEDKIQTIVEKVRHLGAGDLDRVIAAIDLIFPMEKKDL